MTRIKYNRATVKAAQINAIGTVLVAIIALIGVFLGIIFLRNPNQILHNGNLNLIDALEKKQASLHPKLQLSDTLEENETPQKDVRKEQVKIKNKNQPGINIEDSPNAIIQINEEGDNVINQNILEPKINIELIESKRFNGDSAYITMAMLVIETKVNIDNLYLEARSNSITELEINAQRTGIVTVGHSGKRNGFAFTK